MSEADEVTSLSVYKNAFRACPAACLLLSTGPDAIVLAVSDAFAEAFSIEARPIVGVSLYDLSELALVGCESTREALRRSIALVVAGGKPDGVVLTDGERSWRVKHAPVRDESGELVCVR
jgi:hypothetical protein